MFAHLRADWRYLKYVVRHKWYVLLGGLVTGAPIYRLLVHDASKFSRAEWDGYVRKFQGKEMRAAALASFVRSIAGAGHVHAAVARYEAAYDARVDAAFDAAWRHHQKRNDHHWQAWILMEDNPKPGWWGLQSPDEYRYFSLRGGHGDGAMRIPMPALGYEGARSDVEKKERDAWTGAVMLLCQDANRYRALPMPEPLAREMVADWMGAGRALTGAWETKAWYARNKQTIILHPATRVLVEQLIDRAHAAGRA